MTSYTPEERFKFTAGSFEELTGYRFNKKVIQHTFCPTCGMALISQAFGAVAVNVRTVDGLDLQKLKLRFLDGKSR
jgi:hypothetical protein